MHGCRTLSCEDTVEGGPSKWGSNAGSDHDLESFIRVHRAGLFPDGVLALLAVQEEDGIAPDFEIKRKEFFASFTGRVARWCARSSER